MATNSKQNYRKEKIKHVIDVATEVFAEKGFDGARIEDIAKRAKISKWNLYYFAGDKETLYNEVFKQLVIQGDEYIQIDVKANQSAVDNMKKLIRGYASIATMPHLHAMVITEMLHGGKYLPDSILKATSGLIDACKKVLKQGESQGVFRVSNPLVVHMSIFGYLILYNIVIPHVHKSGRHRQLIKKTGITINETVIEGIENIMLEYLTAKDNPSE
jgi:AcrR family transcriptional regulator